MCQHDFNGKRIFQHRNMDKFKFEGNATIRGFEQEDVCFGYVRDLRSKWSGIVKMDAPKTPEGKALYQKIVEQGMFSYERIGDPNKRDIELLPGGQIGRGRDSMEQTWCIDDDPVQLVVLGGSSVTFEAKYESPDSDVLKGKWLSFEQMDVVLTPAAKAAGAVSTVPPMAVASATPNAGTSYNTTLENKRFIYIRVGYDKRVLEFRANNQIGDGNAGLEKVWGVFVEDKKVLLKIGSTLDDPVCALEMGRDGVWRGEWNLFEKMPIELIEVPV